MALPPALTELADTYPLPSNATFKGGITRLLNYAKGLLGATGDAAEARLALGIGPVISFRNLLINGNFAINQRAYVSGVATTGANQYTLDRWRIVTSGQNATFAAASPDRTVTFPAGGGEQVIEGANIVGGVYTLSWTGAATAKVNGAAITNGGNTASLPANTNVTVQFIGAVGLAQFEQGAVATPFERRPSAFELQLCQRYYQVITASWRGTLSYASGLFNQGLSWQPMRAVPTAVAQNGTGFAAANVSADSLVINQPQGGRWESNVGLANTDSYVLNRLWNLSAEL